MPVEVEFGSASWSPRGAVAGDLPLSRAHGPAPAAHAPPQHRALGRYRLRDDSPTRGLVHGTAPFAAVVLEHGPNSVFTRTGALAPGRRGTVAVSPAGHDRGLCAGRCAAGRLLPACGICDVCRRPVPRFVVIILTVRHRCSVTRL